MKKEISWLEKLSIANQEFAKTEDIMELCDCSRPNALQIKREANEYCLKNNMKTNRNRVITEAVLIVIDHDIEYYKNKAELEVKIAQLKELSHN